MGVLIDRVSVVRAYLQEMVQHGLPPYVDRGGQDIVMLLDGVGGFQFIPLLVRKVVREKNLPISTTWFRWQTPIPGLMLVDLMWRTRNRRQAEELAAKMLALHQEHPGARLHIIGYSGGTGIAIFGLESLAGRVPIETLILAAPAISPDYNLAPAMQGVQRAYVLVSCRDTWLLGAGTRIFGTMDRKAVRSAGLVGLTMPPGLTAEEKASYGRIQVVEWCDEFRNLGHRGGHTGCEPHGPRRHLGRCQLPRNLGRPARRRADRRHGGGRRERGMARDRPRRLAGLVRRRHRRPGRVARRLARRGYRPGTAVVPHLRCSHRA